LSPSRYAFILRALQKKSRTGLQPVRDEMNQNYFDTVGGAVAIVAAWPVLTEP
jgi:hypothetical protein